MRLDPSLHGGSASLKTLASVSSEIHCPRTVISLIFLSCYMHPNPLSNSKTLNERLLYHRPSTGEVNRVPSKELLVVRIANRRVDIMVVKNGAKIRVSKDAPIRSQLQDSIQQV